MTLTQFKNEFGSFFVDEGRDVKIARSFKETGSHQRDDVTFLRSFLSSEDIIVDIGAHIGTFAVPFSKRAKKVYAIEPMPETFSLLQKNLEANGATNVTAINSAVSDKEETLAADETPNRAGTTLFSGRQGQGIPAKPLDELIPADEKVSLMKIDVEGMELTVLRGARRIIERDRPIIFLEINTSALTTHGASRAQLEQILGAAGYLFFRSYKEGDGTRPARIWSLYQGYFFDCLAVPREKVAFTYLSPLSFFFRQIGRKIGFIDCV